MSPDVVFFIEHKDRELDSISLLAKYLNEKFGLRSKILSVIFDSHQALLTRAKVFVLPYMLSQEDWPIGPLHRVFGHSAHYLTLNWEQLLFPVNREYKRPRDQFVKMHAQHIAWDDDFKKFLVSHGVNSNHVHVTGNMATELLSRMQIQGIDLRARLAAQFHLNQNHRWIFFPLNFAWSFSTDSMIQGKINKGYPPEKAWRYRQYATECRDSFIHFLYELLDREPDITAIVRPHPSITTDDYLEVIGQLKGPLHPRIFLSKDLTIKEWICSSDMVGSSLSTAVWDAHCIGKPSFLFTPSPRPDFLEVWWKSQVPNVKGYQEWKHQLSFEPKNVSPTHAMGAIQRTAEFIFQLTKEKPTPKADLFKITKQDAQLLAKKYLLRYFLKTRKGRAYRHDFFKPILV